MKNYYKVVAKCGHVGRNNYIPIAFAIIAKCGKEAASIVRDMPRVKHHQKDAIISVTQISEEDYFILNNKNNSDLYLQCKNKQMQNNIPDLYLRVKSDCKENFEILTKREIVYFKLKKYKSLENSQKKQILEYAM